MAMKLPLTDLAGGVNTDKQDYEVPANQWTDVSNVTFRDGKIQKAKGYTSVYGNLSIKPQALAYYQDPDSGAAHWIYPGITDSGDGMIWSVSGTTHVNRTRTTASAAVTDIEVIVPAAKLTLTGYAQGSNLVVRGSRLSLTTFAPTAVSEITYSPSSLIPWTGGTLNGLFVLNNGIDVPQKWDRTNGSLKANFEDLENWPSNTTCRVLRPFRNFLIAMDISVSTNTPDRNPYRVMWSDAAEPYTEPSTWVAAPDNLAGDLYFTEGDDYVVDGAPMRGNFIVYKENSTHIMRYVGGNDVFVQDRLFNEHGLLAARCVCIFGDGMHFAVTKGDVIVHDGNTARSIADDVVRDKIFTDIDSTSYRMAYCVPYYKQEEIWFCYPTTEAVGADVAAIWNYKTGAWTFRDLPTSPDIAYGVTDQQAETTWASDTETWAEDQTPWSITIYNPAAFDLLMVERGSTDAVADAKIHQIDSGNTKDGRQMASHARRTGVDIDAPDVLKYISCIYPKLRGGPVKIRAGGAMSQTGAYKWGPYRTYSPGDGDYKVDVRTTGRFIGYEVYSDGDVDWQLDSLLFEGTEVGKR
jgi:hypothetical protein